MTVRWAPTRIIAVSCLIADLNIISGHQRFGFQLWHQVGSILIGGLLVIFSPLDNGKADCPPRLRNRRVIEVSARPLSRRWLRNSALDRMRPS